MNVYHMTSKNAVKFGTKYEILHIYFISLSDFLWLYYSEFMHNYIWCELYHANEAIL